MKCIRCGKEINYNFGTSDMNGNYCKSCWENFNRDVVHNILDQKDQQIAELKQQLAEKDEEIEILKKALELACKDKLPPDEDVTIKFCDTGFQTSSYEELIEYYEQQAEKEMK